MAANKVFSSDVAIGRGKVVNNVRGRHLDVGPPTEKVLWHVKTCCDKVQERFRSLTSGP